MSRRARAVALIMALLTVPVVACGSGAGGGDALVIYSGRNEGLVGGVLDQLEQATGVDVEVRYGSSGEMAAQLLEEGDGTRADVFFSQDAGALGAVAEQGRLAELPSDVLDLVPAEYRADDGRWVATSARARVVAYDPRVVTEAELPQSLDDVVDPKWKGRIGYAPTNGSWQAFVTSVRVLKGEEFAKDWLRRFAANEPKRYDNNIAILNAVDDGQLPAGLINHYYWYAKVAENGADAVKVKLHHVSGGDPLGLVNVAGAGVIAGNDRNDAAVKAVRFLLSEQAQRYFADETAEYPANPSVKSSKHQLPALTELNGPDIDLSKLSSLQQTLALLQEAGLS
ncbi:iron ABC transporter substrate-binding protein [Saccharothrix deserti]|uniref:iron ABC transporter substrate-binding protein n=1 Tax=Saccharothrix deserti TaxID=2593674 RepID=UPI001EE4C910|nr:iron ABC transporter substrate-binding protein [Saccharothrix deserti]